MSVYRDNAAQVWPNDEFKARRNTCGSDNWIYFTGGGETFYKFLIAGASADEVDKIADAFNAPRLRMTKEAADQEAMNPSNGE